MVAIATWLYSRASPPTYEYQRMKIINNYVAKQHSYMRSYNPLLICDNYCCKSGTHDLHQTTDVLRTYFAFFNGTVVPKLIGP